MNPFKVGDKVRMINHSIILGYPQIGEELIVTCVDGDKIGFVFKGDGWIITKEEEEGKVARFHHNDFELVQTAENITLVQAMKDTLKEDELTSLLNKMRSVFSSFK